MWLKSILIFFLFWLFAIAQNSFFAHFNLFGAVPDIVFILFFLLVFFESFENYYQIIFYAVVAGFFADIFSVFTYIAFGLTLSLFHRDVAKKAFEHNKTNNFNIRFGRVRDIAFVACLAWTGQFWYAAIWAFHLVSIFVATNLDLYSDVPETK